MLLVKGIGSVLLLVTTSCTSAVTVAKNSTKSAPALKGFNSTVYANICKHRIAIYPVKPSDNGKAISLKFYPEDDVNETWASIITCNAGLRSLYSNATEVSYNVSYPMRLLIPDKGELLRGMAQSTGLVSSDGAMENTTQEYLCGCGEEIKVARDTKIGHLQKNLFMDFGREFPAMLVLCNIQIQMKKGVVLSGQTLRAPCTKSEMEMKLSLIATEVQGKATDSVNQQDFANLSDHPMSNYSDHLDRKLIASGPQGGNWDRWDAYSCTNSLGYGYAQNGWIFVGSDPACFQLFFGDGGNRMWDGCSSPVWSAYTWNFIPACNAHDVCYQLSSWRDPNGWPKSLNTRLKCDQLLDYGWNYACESQHCNEWWKRAFGECGNCYTTKDYWMQGVYIGQWFNANPAGWWMTGQEKDSISKYSGASIFLPDVQRDFRGMQAAYVFRQSRGDIRSAMNNKCIDMSGSRVFMYDCNGGWNQQWYRPGNNMQDMRLQMDGNRCLDAPSGQGQLVSWNWCNSNTNQRWVYDDQYRLHPVNRPDLCLDIYGGKTTNLADIVLWPCSGASNQQWYQT